MPQVGAACKEKDLLVEEILQTTCLHCGPACAAMILRHLEGPSSLGSRGVATALRDLKQIMTQFAVPNIETSPKGLEEALNRGNSRFEYSQAFWIDPSEATRGIVASVWAGAPAAVLVKNASHWVVVSGFRSAECIVEQRPVRLKKLFIDDPWNRCLTCGHGAGVTVLGCNNGMPTPRSQETKSVLGWLQYFNPSFVLGNRFAAVIAQDVDGGIEIELLEQEGLHAGGDLPVEDYVNRGILFLELDEHRYFVQAVNDGSIRQTVPVINLAPGGSPYHLIDIGTEEGTLAVLQIDAQSGAILGARGFEEPVAGVVPDRGAVAEKLLEVGIVVDPDEPLVWKPSQESRSPYDPLFRAKLSNTDALGKWHADALEALAEDELFVDLNGGVHRGLND